MDNIQKQQLISYLLQLGDNGVILGHRLSEWCGHGPVLEQDIAMTNMALDHIGQARNFYQYAATLFNELPIEERKAAFASDALVRNVEQGIQIDEDDIAFLRDAWDYKNLLLVELPNEDFAYTIARAFFYDHYAVLLFTALSQCTDTQVRAIAEKSLKEALYHRKWSSEWVIRLGDGTDESKAKMTQAIQDRWAYTGEAFRDYETDLQAHQLINAPLPSSLYAEWKQQIAAILEEATIDTPSDEVYMHEGGKTGTHTEHLGFILAEMQFMQRAYPNMEW